MVFNDFISHKKPATKRQIKKAVVLPGFPFLIEYVFSEGNKPYLVWSDGCRSIIGNSVF